MTTFLSKKNNANSKVATVGGIDNSTDPVTFAVTTGEGSKFPASNFVISIDNEILLCTSRTGDNLTCTRAAEGTTIAAHTQNANVEIRITAATLEEYEKISNLQGMDFAADDQTSDTYAITLAPAPTAYFTGMVVKFKANTLNTGACTLNVNALGAKTIKKNVTADLETGDILANQMVTVIYDGTNFQVLSRLPVTTLLGNDGWTNANESWAYATANTITVPSGAAAKYKKGDKIKLTQTTVKYFYVTAVADTVLTVTGGTDYTVANAAITNNYYSHQENPIGFPDWFNCAAPTWATTSIDNGTGGQQPTAGSNTFKIIGLQVFIRGALGGSNVKKVNSDAVIAISALPATLPVNSSFFNLPCGVSNPAGINALVVDRDANLFWIYANSSIADNTGMEYTAYSFNYRY